MVVKSDSRSGKVWFESSQFHHLIFLDKKLFLTLSLFPDLLCLMATYSCTGLIGGENLILLELVLQSRKALTV